MARGKNKRHTQDEKLLDFLRSGDPVTMEEIKIHLGDSYPMHRIADYVHLLRRKGAQITSYTDHKKHHTLVLLNPEFAETYLESRGLKEELF